MVDWLVVITVSQTTVGASLKRITTIIDGQLLLSLLILCHILLITLGTKYTSTKTKS